MQNAESSAHETQWIGSVSFSPGSIVQVTKSPLQLLPSAKALSQASLEGGRYVAQVELQPPS
jgi:hypothetical protein